MPVASSGPRFSLREIPFSYSGSWFNFSPVIAEKACAPDVHLVSHQSGMHPVLRLMPVGPDGSRLHAEVSATPALLTWAGAGGEIGLAYEKPDGVRIAGRGMALQLAAAEA